MRKSAEALGTAFSLVTFDLESAPKLERKPDPPKEKKPKAAKGETAPVADKAASGSASGSQAVAPESKKAKKSEPTEAPAADASPKAQKKEKKEKKPAEEGSSKKGGNAKAAAPAEDAGEPVPSMIDLRVGHIIEGT